MPRSKQQLVDGKRHALYKKLMGEAEKAHAGAIKNWGDYWWSLFLIKQGQLWKDGDGDCKSEREWVKSLRAEGWGPSYQNFYDTWKAFNQWQDSGITEETKLKLLLGSGKTATKQDLDNLFDKKRVDGETVYEVKPEVAEELENKGETVADLILRANDLGASDARKEVRRFYEKDHIHFLEPLERVGNILLVRVKWEHEEDGLIFQGTIRISFSQDLPDEKDEAYCPDEIMRVIATRFGVDYQ